MPQATSHKKYIPKKVEELYSTHAIVSKPFEKKILWYKNCFIWETSVPYLYHHTISDNRIFVKVKDSEFSNPDKLEEVIASENYCTGKVIRKTILNHSFKTDIGWAGTGTKDGLPYAASKRQRPNTYFALGLEETKLRLAYCPLN
ncbi:hypothetical protein BH10BAC4_BH10BAC4_17700 [soil metagenome]